MFSSSRFYGSSRLFLTKNLATISSRRGMMTKSTNVTTSTSNVLCLCALALTTITTFTLDTQRSTSTSSSLLSNNVMKSNDKDDYNHHNSNTMVQQRTYCEDIINTGTPVKEKATGILFPQLCNGFFLAGTGVRYKWGMIQVYAVGTYLDNIAMDGIKKMNNKQMMEDALLNPDYPRTIRIVMARNLNIQTFMDGIVESIKPRLNGQELEKLDEFKKLNAPVDLVKGAVIEMTIRGESLLYKDATGNIGILNSKHFNRALCDVYYGKECVSSTHKQAVLDGIPKL